MRTLSKLAILLLTGSLLASCDLQREAGAKFGDQNFKTAIALIELHHLRFGTYPDSLADLRFTGAWDPNAIVSVDYHRAGSGYELNLVRGWIGAPELSYPAEFWHGLGIVKSNVHGLAPAASK
jgi:hypothetical protein